MTVQRLYSAGPANTPFPTSRIKLLGRAIHFLILEQRSSGVWGGPDTLDQLISTCHTSMALLAAGFLPDSFILARALAYLEHIDTEANISFFWRSAVFLNMPSKRHIVDADASYLWTNRRRIGVHRDYPVPFFLLKLLRFSVTPPPFPETAEVVSWILEDWNEDTCWYGRTSITSMATALLCTEEFEGKADILARSVQFLVEMFDKEEGKFSSNLIDDCYTVFNLCERRHVMELAVSREGVNELWEALDIVASRIERNAVHGAWRSPAPFGGSVTSPTYPTAVAVRALMAHESAFSNDPLPYLASELLTYTAERRWMSVGMEPFWGPKKQERVNGPKLCFVLMPFDERLTQIYERYVRKPLAEAGFEVKRADDIYRPSQIMDDVWQSILAADVIVADLSHRNPNVFYELGLAHSRRRDVILIASTIEDVPFDLRSVRVLIYGSLPSQWERLGAQLMESCRELGHLP